VLLYFLKLALAQAIKIVNLGQCIRADCHIPRS
jgi:hypothetical protein